MKVSYPELSEAQIAKRVGCSAANVHSVLARFLGDSITEDDHKAFTENQADVLGRVKHRILMSITNADIEKASLLQKATAFGIIHDKDQVLRGNATTIGVTVLMDAVEAVRAMRDKS